MFLQKLKRHLVSLRILFFLILSVILISNDVSQYFLQRIPYFLFFFLVSFSIGYSLIPVFHKLGILLGVIDEPGGRKAHSGATPLLGGIAIYITFTVLVNFTWGNNESIRALFYAVSIIAVLGVIDDILPLPALLKLIVQVVSVSILIVHGIKISLLPYSWWGNLIEILLTIIWVVGITNAFNFLDGLDGLASGTAAIIAFFFFLLAYALNDYGMAIVSVVLCGSVLAFLPYNMRPGKNALIFLGDAGSTFLGFSLASLAIYGTWGKSTYIDLVSPVLLLSVPIFDMVQTTMVRVWTGKVKSFNQWLEYTGRDHFHHRLLQMGFSRKQTTLAIWTLTAVFGCTSLMILKGGNKIALISLLQAILLFGLITGIMVAVQKKMNGE